MDSPLIRVQENRGRFIFTLPLLTELAGEGGATERVSLSLSGRDLILVFGGLFLIAKATYEIHHLMEGAHEQQMSGGPTASVGMVITEIALLDIGHQHTCLIWRGRLF